jgi:predicted nucleotidyltransferase
MKEILKVIVGSHSHGLNDETSDTDYRSVFIHPTEFLLTIGAGRVGLTNESNTKNEKDDVSFELTKFCSNAAKCNPTMLEILKSPIVKGSTAYGEELVKLFPHFLAKKHIYNAFKGYSFQQRKELQRGALSLGKRRSKYKTAALRILYNGIELLRTGDFTIRIVDTELAEICKRARRGELPDEEFFTICDDLELQLGEAYTLSQLADYANYAEINKFILRVRKENWTENENTV